MSFTCTVIEKKSWLKFKFSHMILTSMTIDEDSLVVHGTMGCSQESFKLVRRCLQLLSGFLVSGHLPWMSRQSYLLANDTSDSEVILGAVHKFPDIYLTTEENPRKLQLGNEDCVNGPHIKWGPLPPNDVCRITQRGENGGIRKVGRSGSFFEPVSNSMDYLIGLGVGMSD